MPQSFSKGYNVTAVLGPTNTGKTHMAIERMVAHKTGVIGLPLRLLAREVYTRICDKVGVANVSLVTGEERIIPPGARYQVCTVEAMPERTNAEFVAIDEIQLATDLDRGHFFTDRLLNLRGKHETMLLGAETMTDALRELLPGIEIISRPRMSMLEYVGSKKLTRMPTRSAIVAFSTEEVYAIAELVRRERGGAAVVTGSLSPRTRNAQVALYQSGDVDFLVATDAIGMGLNLDVHHVAFAQDTKFDGFQFRRLTAAELAQVAGRAGRHTKDGTFGTTSKITPFEDELIEALETHTFAPAKILTWRNSDLEFSSPGNLFRSLETSPTHRRLMKSPPNTDLIALDKLASDDDILARCQTESDVRLLWEVVKTPDYRKISPTAHSEILSEVFMNLTDKGHINETWFADQVAGNDNTNGEIDALSKRIANIRTCTYLANRDNWLENCSEWREKTSQVEDKLSDALHETLTKRFIDRRTSILMKRLKENKMLEAEIGANDEVKVEGLSIGHLKGFRFVADGSSGGKDTKALNAAAAKALAAEIEKRAERLAACPNSDIVMDSDATIRWLGEPIARLAKGDNSLKPRTILLTDEQLTGLPLEKASARIERWVSNHINTLLKPLFDLENNIEIEGIARGIAFQISENLGILDRKSVADDIKKMDQDTRGILRRNGVRFGAYHIFVPSLLKPAPTQLICLLWAIANDKVGEPGMIEVPGFSSAGRTSVAVEDKIVPQFYALSGFKVLGGKAVRIDILERLADLVRPTTLWKPDSGTEKPEGAIDGRAFYVTPAMMSILGATHDDMSAILSGLGYKSEKKLEEDIKGKSDLPEKPIEEPVADSDLDSDTNVKVETVSEAPTEPDEPKTILIWRFGGGQKKKSFKPNQKGKSNKDGNKKFQPKGRNKTAPAKKDKEPDPDSPFAKLAALKENLN